MQISIDTDLTQIKSKIDQNNKNIKMIKKSFDKISFVSK